jgi:uncharacterized protein
LVSIPAVPAAAQFPEPTGLINDFAEVIPQDMRQKMEALATEVLQKTGAEIAVVTMLTIGDSEADTYVNRLFQAWGIGKKGEDNGVLIFMTVKERRIRIETGYGVEGILPDGLVGEILDKHTIPFLRNDDYGTGLYNALAAVSSVIAKDANVELSGRAAVHRRPQRRVRPFGLLPIVFIFFILVFAGFRRRRGRWILPLLLLGSMGGRGGYGGGFGGFGGGFGGFGGGMSGGGGAGRGF